MTLREALRPARGANEPVAVYRSRRAQANAFVDEYLRRGRVWWDSSTRGTYRKRAQVLIPLPVTPRPVAKLNCAGRGCADAAECRRYRVNIGEEWRGGTGQWGSFDVEREVFGDCRAFVRWHGDRRAA